MLKFFSSKVDHPLADAKEVRRIVAELVGGDAVQALREIHDWLAALDAAAEIPFGQRLSVLLQFDDALQPHLRQATRDYLVAPNRVKVHTLWPAAHGAWQRLAQGYVSSLDAVTQDPKHKEAQKQLPTVCARLIHAHAQWLKWTQFRYGPPEPTMWKNMGRAYLAAVAGGFDKKRFAALPGAGGETSVHDEYAKAVMFQASSVDHLRPLEIELAERLLAHLLPHVVLSAESRPENVFWVDPARSIGPMRLVRPPHPSPTVRFLHAGRALPAIGNLLTMARRDEMPNSLDLGAQYAPKALIPVLNHLGLYWAPKPPTREHQRHAVRSGVASIVGFGMVFRRLSGEFTEPAQWEIDDVSRGGFGLKVQLGDQDAPRQGTLVGLQPEGGDNWLVGIVRRLSREKASVLRIGVQTLSTTPIALQVDVAGVASSVLLLDRLEPDTTVRLAYPQFGYEENVVVTLCYQGRSAELRPLGLIESGEECDLARYHVTRLSPTA